MSRSSRPGPAPRPEARIPAQVADDVHRSLLAGLLSHIGMQDVAKTGQKRRGPAEFTGARGSRFAIFPDSVLAQEATALGHRR